MGFTIDGEFTTIESVYVFMIVVAVIAISYGINIATATFPQKSSVKKMYKHAEDIDQYLYYSYFPHRLVY